VNVLIPFAFRPLLCTSTCRLPLGIGDKRRDGLPRVEEEE
jgi:hypothetical protein